MILSVCDTSHVITLDAYSVRYAKLFLDIGLPVSLLLDFKIVKLKDSSCDFPAIFVLG